MGFMHEFPHTTNFDSDLREIVELYFTLKDLPKTWENYKQLMDSEFAELKTFVNEYFDNLDVQNEINNKIDSMVTDGTMLNIIRTIFNEYVTPQMFGAVGDGVTDDTIAFQNVLNSGKYVYVPIGCYRITSPITVNNKDLVVIGQNAPHLQGGLFNANEPLKIGQVYSCLFADFETDGTLLTVSDTCYRATIEGICFVSNKYEMSFNNSTYETTETVAEEVVNGLNCVKRVLLSKCAFYGFSGYALSIQAQHSGVTDCTFSNNNDCIHLDSYDHRFSGLWVSRFRRGIYNKDTTRGKIEMNNCWFDQGLGHCMEFTSLPTIIFNDVWIDLIGGCAIYCESTYGDMSGMFTGRINRTNILAPYTDYASIQVGRANGLMVFVSSSQTHPNGNDSVPLFKYTNRALNCVFFAPTRNNVYVNNGYNQNLVVDNSGCYITHGSTYPFRNGGVQVRPSFSDEYNPPQIGALQFNTNTQLLYVCTSLEPVTWSPVKSS